MIFSYFGYEIVIPKKVKEELIHKSLKIIEERINQALNEIEQVQLAANLESKSSAGDKYETGRAMMQQEKDKAESGLALNNKLKNHLENIPVSKTHKSVQLGSVVTTDRGNFFIAVAIGKINHDNKDYLVISPASPIGSLLMNKKKGDNVSWNNQSYIIQKVE